MHGEGSALPAGTPGCGEGSTGHFQPPLWSVWLQDCRAPALQGELLIPPELQEQTVGATRVNEAGTAVKDFLLVFPLFLPQPVLQRFCLFSVATTGFC